MVLYYLEVQIRLIQTSILQVFFTLSEKTRLTNIQKYQLQETFFPVRNLLFQLTLINVYSMRQLEDIVFYISLSFSCCSLQQTCSCTLWNKWLELKTSVGASFFTSFFAYKSSLYKWDQIHRTLGYIKEILLDRRI